MSASLAVAPEDMAIITSILAQFLPPDAKVWAYGSRARNSRVHRGSDLDLAIDAGPPLSLCVEGMLDECFSESLLPYKVDFVDVHFLSPEFHAAIARDFQPIEFAAAEIECTGSRLPR